MDTNSLSWSYNDKCIQNYDSNVCGYHVVCYCLSKKNNISLFDYTNAFFNDEHALNDSMVVYVVEKMKSNIPLQFLQNRSHNVHIFIACVSMYIF